MKPAYERVMRRVDQDGECLVFKGAKNRGYGMVGLGRVGDGIDRAHRVVWRHFNGEIGAGLVVCHSCDNPACVRLDHLFIGTHGENARDRDAKDRVQHGERHYAAKLSADDVIAIRSIARGNRITRRELGLAFGISGGHVSEIVHRKARRRS